MSEKRTGRRQDAAQLLASPRIARLLAPWRQPWPWVSLALLALCSRSEPPRLWFWLSLLLISLLVGFLQSLARRP